jgi:hypothetical protein
MRVQSADFEMPIVFVNQQAARREELQEAGAKQNVSGSFRKDSNQDPMWDVNFPLCSDFVTRSKTPKQGGYRIRCPRT